jgi:hypothetical protein
MEWGLSATLTARDGKWIMTSSGSPARCTASPGRKPRASQPVEASKVVTMLFGATGTSPVVRAIRRPHDVDMFKARWKQLCTVPMISVLHLLIIARAEYPAQIHSLVERARIPSPNLSCPHGYPMSYLYLLVLERFTCLASCVSISYGFREIFNDR